MLTRTFPSQGLGDDPGGGDGGSNPEGPAGTRREGGTGVSPPTHKFKFSTSSVVFYYTVCCKVWVFVWTSGALAGYGPLSHLCDPPSHLLSHV